MQLSSSLALESFESLGESLARLALPSTGPKDAFDLLGMGCFGPGAPLQRLSIKPEHFESTEDYEKAEKSSQAWTYQNLAENKTDIRAATSLQMLLGHVGDPVEQAKAIECFETFFPAMSLSLNNYADYGTIDYFLECQEEYRRSSPSPQRPALFSTEGPDWEDRFAVHRTGLWTVKDYSRGPSTAYVLAAASTPGGALIKAWKNAPHLKAFWRMASLDGQLPAPVPGRRGPRF